MNIADLTKEEKARLKEHQKQCEARYWLTKYQKMLKTDGKYRAREWWDKVIKDIERIRGKDGADELRGNMNVIRGN